MGAKEFGALIRERREQQGMSQQDLAHDADMAIRTLSNIENGLAAPNMTTLSGLLRALQIDPREALSIYDDQPYNPSLTPDQAIQALQAWNDEDRKDFLNRIGLGGVVRFFGRSER